MISRFAWFPLIVVFALTPVAHGQVASIERPADFAPLTIHVACGELFNSPCVKVLPKLAARTVQAGLILNPVETGAALDTAAVVCAGQVGAAIVQRDAMAKLGQQPSCLGRYELVGRSLFPWYAFLVVRADAPFRQLDDIGRDGRRGIIAAGAEGSGGQVTLAFLAHDNPAALRSISVTHDAFEPALQQIADGAIDGFFAMETLDSALLDQVRMRRDARGKPLFTFIDVRPGQDLPRSGGGLGRCLYRLTALDFGGPAPFTTLSTDAVMVIGRTVRDAHARGGPRALDALVAAIDAARPAILADMRSPRDWRPAGNSCI
jgi:hypothetical protein